MPQPSPSQRSYLEKYSNNVDATLASGLEARSYQPGLNSHKDSATLVSLERRDSGWVTDDDVISENLASTVDRARNGDYALIHIEEAVGKKIGSTVGDMVTKYIGMSTHINGVLGRWERNSLIDTLNFIKSGLGDDEYSKIEPDPTDKFKGLEDTIDSDLIVIYGAIGDILEDVGSDADNFQKIHESVNHIFRDRGIIFSELEALLGRFTAGKTLKGYLADVNRSITELSTYQRPIYEEIMKKLRAASSE
ncbi:hypothetical protein BASA61_010096 [Batrachochytrium salamandrivorans]|nr:hypothetical protein BASA61_010096 [Batrachochytrium salamandrivorans]